MNIEIRKIHLTLSVEEYMLILDSLCRDSVDRPKYIALNKAIEKFKKIRDNPLGNNNGR